VAEAFRLNVQILNNDAQPPKRFRPAEAGFDLATIEDINLTPGERRTCGLGFATEFPASYVAVLRDRSGLGSRGLHCLAGVIDASYRGEWKVVLLNTSSENINIKKGERIAQCLFLPVPSVDVQIVEQLPDSDRGAEGFGSSGK
jgi:dUTP pyrophosphatase